MEFIPLPSLRQLLKGDCYTKEVNNGACFMSTPSISLIVRNGLKASNLHTFDEVAASKKEGFHQDARIFLASLAEALELSRVEILNHEGTASESGEVTLLSNHLFVKLFEATTRRGITIQFCSRESHNDFNGGPSRFAHPEKLQGDPIAQAAFLDACRKMMVEGMLSSRRRSVA